MPWRLRKIDPTVLYPVTSQLIFQRRNVHLWRIPVVESAGRRFGLGGDGDVYLAPDFGGEAGERLALDG
jgi:hypothetical protein